MYVIRFRWAVCQLDALKNCLTLPMLRKALASLPKTLDDTYARILCSIDEEHSKNALKILQWLVYSARPLRIEEIAEVIAVDIEDNPRFDTERRLPEPRDILTICSSLVTIVVEEAKEQVRLAHFSVKEYLVSERAQIEHSIREIPANISIAETCLAYLLQFEYSHSLTFRTAEEYPLSRYAAQYWTQHAQLAEKHAGIIRLLIMELFLSKRVACVNWIRLFNPDMPRKGPDITRTFNSVASSLYYASLTGLAESAKLLLEKGAEVNAQEGRYGNALQAASVNGHGQITQQLIEKGADVNAQGGYYGNALQAALAEGHDQIVQQLLEKVVDINAQGGYYGNALQAASASGYDQIVQQLLEKGANVNAQGGYYGNALQAASAEGHDQIVRQLLEKGANVNAQGGYYGNALQAASAEGHDQIVQQLLEKGADINAQGGGYGNALQVASAYGHDQIVQRLLEKGADVNAQGGRYGNALQAASAGGHDEIVRQLLEKGADINAQGGYYSNALQAASAKGHNHIVQQLKSAIQSQQHLQPRHPP
jgi:ankyrin repeat protein